MATRKADKSKEKPAAKAAAAPAVSALPDSPGSSTKAAPELNLVNLRAVAALGCTQVEAAAFFQVSERTIIRRLKDRVWFEAWDQGRAVGRVSLRRLQWKHAQKEGSAAVQMTIHLSKFNLGETERSLQISGPGGGPIPVFDVSKLKDMTPEQLDVLDGALAKLGMSVTSNEQPEAVTEEDEAELEKLKANDEQE